MNKYTQHIPGPWTVYTEVNSRRKTARVTVRDPHHNEVAQVYGETRGEAETDARLIAAAPELLKALRGLVAAYGGDRDFSAEDNVNSYDSAIALIDRIEGGAE